MASKDLEVSRALQALTLECQHAIRSGSDVSPDLKASVRGLAKAMRESNAAPEILVVNVKSAVFEAGLGQSRDLRYMSSAARGALIGDLVTLAIKEFYSVPPAPGTIRSKTDLDRAETRLIGTIMGELD